MASLPIVKEGKIILMGENPFIWLYDKPNGNRTTEASIWTITHSPKGAGQALFIKSELTQDQWRIYSDNPNMARWLQETVQGMLNPETSSNAIPIFEASFSRSGETKNVWTQIVKSVHDEIVMQWQDMKEPLLVQDETPSDINRAYGVNAVMIPATTAKIMVNGKQAKGEIQPMELNGHSFATGALAFCENWREENEN